MPSHPTFGLFLALSLAGCSFTFDDTAPEIPLLGTAPSLNEYPRLNRAPTKGQWMVYGADDAYWYAVFEPPGTLRLTRLSPPFTETELLLDGFFEVVWRAIYITALDPDNKRPTELTIRSAGETGDPATFIFPPGSPYLVSGGADDVFTYWIKDPATTTFQIVHRDHSYTRTIPIPEGIEPDKPAPGTLFFFNGSHVITRDAKDRIVSHSATEEIDIDLGVRPKTIGYVTGDASFRYGPHSDGYAPDKRVPEFRLPGKNRPSLITIGDDGVRRVPIDGSPEIILDSTPTSPDFLFGIGNDVAYLVGDELRRVPLDGSGPYSIIRKGDFVRIYGTAPDGQLVFSKDPGTKYIYGVGDAWLGDWRFMERGLYPTFSHDGTRVRWLEHAAQASGSGDLLSAELPIAPATLPTQSPLRLARNAHRFTETGDGRLLAVTNRAFLGSQNRVVIIDEKKQTAKWVADHAVSYKTIPGSTDILVDVITGPTTRDVVRVPVPEK